MDEKLKIVFAGTPEFAIPSLAVLLHDPAVEILAVFTQPDKPAGRGKIFTPPPVKTFAEENEIPVFQEKLDLEIIHKKFPEIDFIVVVAFGVMLSKELLEVPRFGCVNLHASLLPKFRGASPIQSAILASESKTGVSFMRISEQLDAGDVFAQFEIEIGEKNTEQLGMELAKLGEKFPEVLKKIVSGDIQSTPQDDAGVTFCKKIQKSDGRADWQKDSAELLVRKLQAFTPWPGVWTKSRGKNLKLLEFSSWQLVASDRQSGEVFEKDGRVGVVVADSAIELKKVQLEGKKELQIEDFLRGNADFIGNKLG